MAGEAPEVGAMIQPKKTVHLIEFSDRLVFPYGQGALPEYLAAFGAKPRPDRLGLPDECYRSEPGLHSRIRSLSVSLLMDGISHEEGPYADSGYAMQKLCNDVARDADGSLPDLLGKIIDRVRPYDGSPAESLLPRINGFGRHRLLFEPRLAVSDALPTAGVIMADEARNPDGEFMLIHPLEPYILSCAILRMGGLMAYPARAFSGDEGEDAYAPLIAVFPGDGDEAMATFRLIRSHPDVSSLEVWSDTAVMGALHAMRAVTRANRLGADSVTAFLEGGALSEEALSLRLEMIASDLSECDGLFRAEEDHLVQETMQAIFSHLFQAEAWKSSREALKLLPSGGVGPDIFLASRGISKAAPLLPINAPHTGMLMDSDERILGHYPKLRELITNAWSEAARTAEDLAERIGMMVHEAREGPDDAQGN